ncbi:hypothetical protein KI387_005485, partial [Taxus chinensis]
MGSPVTTYPRSCPPVLLSAPRGFHDAQIRNLSPSESIVTLQINRLCFPFAYLYASVLVGADFLGRRRLSWSALI